MAAQTAEQGYGQLKASKPLLGKDGAFAPLLESILNAAHWNDEK